MSTLVAQPAAAPPARESSAALALAPREAWRLVRHPVALAGVALNVVLVVSVGTDGGRSSFSAVTTGSTFYSGVFVYFAANIAATRERRSGSRELLGPLPGGAHARTIALCLAALGPALLNALLVAVAFAAFTARDLFVVSPSFWHLAQGPLTVLGGALLGVMVGRWAPYPGAALVVMVAMVAFNVMVSNGAEQYRSLGMEVSWARWGPNHESSGWYGYYPGSVAWHDVYLGALCAMAAAGALLRTTAAPLRVLTAGAACTAAMLLAAWGQLP
jgi:hypothetical protein